ncbi:MAG: nucleotide exchange factor GrpE [Deltaproteobacteria bacterium]|nr:MAG: nucleotide exchange factor GrpE [Deltaproteobacteria bacterium]
MNRNENYEQEIFQNEKSIKDNEDLNTKESSDLEDREKTLANENDLLKDKLLRLAADFDNFKKRSDRDQKISQKYANELLLIDLLPVLDNLDHVIEMNAQVKDPVVEGVKMISKQFEDVLAKHNIKRESSIGTDFDPTKHEAIEYQEIEEIDSGKVIKEYQKSYWLNNRLIRPSRVVVSK